MKERGSDRNIVQICLLKDTRPNIALHVNAFFDELLKEGYINFVVAPKKGKWYMKACEVIQVWQRWPLLSKLLGIEVTV